MIVKEKNGEGFLDLRICDNLELMAEIKDNTIDLIYCDILYGTGRKFKDYQDLKPIRSEIKSHYIPRIKEMHRILKPTGSIYLQMDTRINHWMRCIMDDVFGYENFRNEIIWAYKSSGSSSGNYAKKYDIILYYRKSKNFTWNPLKVKTILNNQKNREYSKKYGGHFDNNGDWIQLVNIKNYWDDIPIVNKLSNRNENVNYDTQKPKALIERIIKASSNEGDLVADFYSGSFTTAEVCKDLKRSFIGCDINPNCFEKAKERGLFSFTDLPTNVD